MYASLDNLIIDKDGNIHFIDYDGIQINGNRSFSISSSIDIPLINTPKYFDKDRYFTQELNIFSHYVIFFLDLINSKITTIGQTTPNGNVMDYDLFFEITGIDDYDIQNKIWKLFQPNERNEYLGEDLRRIQEEYKVEVIGRYNGMQLKRLVRK